MNKFFAWLYYKCVNSVSEPNANKVVRVREFDDKPQTEGTMITVWGATGGNIVEFRRYDYKTDRTQNKLYIIPSDSDFSESLAKIITLEMLR